MVETPSLTSKLGLVKCIYRVICLRYEFFREHKITQVLKECLGSLTCHAAMIAHVSQAPANYTETLTTVQLASRIHRMRRKKFKASSLGYLENYRPSERSLRFDEMRKICFRWMSVMSVSSLLHPSR